MVDLLPAINNSLDPGEDNIRKIIQAAALAPSSGNNQPWKWLYRKKKLHLFHDRSRSASFSNFNNSASYLALGAAYENAILKSRQLGFYVKSMLFPLGAEHDLAAVISFLPEGSGGEDNPYATELTDYIYTRSTNRNSGSSLPLDDQDYAILKSTAESLSGVRLHFITDSENIAQMAKLTSECDLVSILNDHGHEDFFERKIKWPPGQPSDINEGISALSLGMTPSQLALLAMIRDKKIARTLRRIGGGNSVRESIENNISSASCLALLTLPSSIPNKFFMGGISAQRLWLRAEQLGFAVQPLHSPLSLFARLESGKGLDENETEKLVHLRKMFRSITNLDEKLDEVFLIKIARADASATRANRLPLNEILFMVNDEI